MNELDARPTPQDASRGSLLIGAIVLAVLTEAVAGTALSLGRSDIIGDTHSTPDEFAWLDMAYVGMKFVGFLLSPWLMGRLSIRSLLVAGTLVMGIACGITSITTGLGLLAALRGLQGFTGGILLVAGQAAIFLAYPKARQPLLQALFAMSAVVAPATLAPALQGWLIDSQSWAWIFFGVAPLSLVACGALLLSDSPSLPRLALHSLDGFGLTAAAITLLCLTYVISQGSRWDWFEEPRIVELTLVGAAALLAFLATQFHMRGGGLLDLSLFASEDFSFAFMVSFVAGAALFGSAFLIPSFAVAVLGFTPTGAGQLLLPSGGFFIASLLISAYLMQAKRVPPVATVPIGVLMIMAAMWMLSGSTSQSGSTDMMAPVLLRGFGLGFLFLSITLIAFSGLGPGNLASGIALFNTGRQLGGLLGVAGLQTLIERDIANNVAVLGASLTPGAPVFAERLATTAAAIASRGIEPAVASRAAFALLQRSVTGQATVIAFDSAFVAIALLFVVAAPVLVGFKIALRRYKMRRASSSSVYLPAPDLSAGNVNGGDL